MSKFSRADELKPPSANGSVAVLEPEVDEPEVQVDEPTEESEEGEISDDLGAKITACGDTITSHIMHVGQAPRTEIRKLCIEEGHDKDTFGRAFRFLTTTIGLLIEDIDDNGKKVFRFKNRPSAAPDLRTFYSLVQKKMQKKGEREVFSDWHIMEGQLYMMSACLGSRPPESREQGKREFFRAPEGELMLFDFYFEKMFQSACMQPGTPAHVARARYALRWDWQLMPKSKIKRIMMPVPPQRKGLSGQGLTECECLPPGTRIPFKVLVPGSHITPNEFMQIMRAAGKWVGFSVAQAHKGFGRFIPEFKEVPETDE